MVKAIVVSVGVALGILCNDSAAWAALVQPSDVSAEASSSSSIKLVWNDSNVSVTGFIIQRSMKATTGFKTVATTDNVRSYVDDGRLPSTTYYYRLRARVGTRTSRLSKVASATTMPAGAAPTVAPTETATPTVTATPSRTATAVPTTTATATALPTVTRTATPVPTATATQLPTATRTATAIPTATTTPIPTSTATATTTATRTATAVPTTTRTATPLPTATATVTATPTATRTSTPVPTATSTPGTFDPVLVGFLPGLGSATDVALDGDVTFVASDPFGLSLADTTDDGRDAAAPFVLGTSPRPFQALHVAGRGNRAVVTGVVSTGHARLWVLNTSDPTAPQILGELATTTMQGTVTGIFDVALNGAGTVAVTALGMGGIGIVDLSNPSAPTLRATYDTPGTAYAVALDVTGTLAYVADGNGGLKIVSVANPSAPTLVGAASVGGILRDVAVAGGVAYAADQQGRLVTVDVSTPSTPVKIGELLTGGSTFNVAVEGARAVIYRISNGDYLQVIDVSVPASPVKLGETWVALQNTVKGLTLVGGRAYVASALQGVKMYSVAGTPALAGTLTDTFVSGHVAAAGTRAVVTGTVVATSKAHLLVLDATDPTAPEIVGQLPTAIAQGSVTGFFDVAMNDGGTLAVAAMGMAGVGVLDLTDPTAPVLRATYDTPGTAYAVALNAAGSLAYVADGNGGLKIVSLANPSAPTLVGTASVGGILRDVAVASGVAYAADQQGRLVTIDVATPSAPVKLGELLTGGYTFNVAVDGNRAIIYRITNGDYLQVIDVSAPASPVKVGETWVELQNTVKGLALAGNRAFVAASTQQVKVFDIGGGTPVLLEAGMSAGDAMDVIVNGGQLFVADSPATLSIVDLYD